MDELSFDVRRGEICALLAVTAPEEYDIDAIGPPIRARAKSKSRRGHAARSLSRPFNDQFLLALCRCKRLTSENLMVYSGSTVSESEKRVVRSSQGSRYRWTSRSPLRRTIFGQKTRVSLAKSLLNEPDLLLLDEPTASLDPETADWVRTYLKNFQQDRGATILLASHNIEVERLCDDVVMMKEGSIVDRPAPPTC